MNTEKNKLIRLTELRYETLPLLLDSTCVDSPKNIGDPVSRVLKCHLLSEVVLDKLLTLALEPNGEAVLAAGLRYRQKLDIASQIQLMSDWPLLPGFVVGSLRQLNKIRNRLAHEINAIVTREEVLKLFMGIEHPMPCDPNDAEISLLIYHYTPFLFGNMLPKYESILEDK